MVQHMSVVTIVLVLQNIGLRVCDLVLDYIVVGGLWKYIWLDTFVLFNHWLGLLLCYFSN